MSQRTAMRPMPDLNTAESAVVAGEIRYSDGWVTGWHSHPRGQLLYASKGVMIVNSRAGSWVVPPNRALWFPAGLEHEVRMSGEVHMRTAYIDEARVEGVPATACVLRVSALMRELIVAATSAQLDYAEGSRGDLILRLLVQELRQSHVLPLHLPVPEDERIQRICKALIEDTANADTALQWAHRVGVAPKTVHRLFQKETGMGFAQWREQARLLLALRKLASGERIIDIAFDCGYASQSAFTAMFRRRFGVPPSAFFG
ncbi:AraC family transcriptional regulator [Diaphorobacter ruginosibacter]|nr:helix-turn-helix transcriptional regulator [Diaphorobacter ruginosibacter]